MIENEFINACITLFQMYGIHKKHIVLGKPTSSDKRYHVISGFILVCSKR